MRPPDILLEEEEAIPCDSDASQYLSLTSSITGWHAHNTMFISKHSLLTVPIHLKIYHVIRVGVHQTHGRAWRETLTCRRADDGRLVSVGTTPHWPVVWPVGPSPHRLLVRPFCIKARTHLKNLQKLSNFSNLYIDSFASLACIHKQSSKCITKLELWNFRP